ncbi:phosphopantothenoylcysteine decarboxylase subunit VHS3-like [Helianthus annuus]|uniref:phosphopantothenoylcysteine decarboxylase subunit VHS3-like n=1 Tax=Helianthus annuus TaxID=4232 RepID=UPI000B90222A|nr:phosphopantothenoylcysteine decarboxylase subunit VHS3-like [Helianthus annuus]
MIERFGHLKLELARHGVIYSQEELVDKLFDSLPDEMYWQYFALMIKNTIKPEELAVDLLIERLESHELEIKKTHKKGHFKRECRNDYADDSANPFREDYYKKAIYHQNKSKPPRLKQIEEDEDNVDDKIDDKPDDDNDKDDRGDDDNDQGASGLLVKDPIVQERIEELLNDEINEQEDDVQNEASSSGKQHDDQVLLSNSTVIYLNVPQEGEVEVRRTRAEMLEELGLEEGKFKFDIEDEIPQSPAKDFEP